MNDKELALSLLNMTVRTKYYGDEQQPMQDWDYTSLEDSIKELYPNKKVEVTFNEECGYMSFRPEYQEKHNYYHNHLTIKRLHTTFIYSCIRFGIVDADYQITNYIMKNNKIIKLSNKEIAEKVYLEIMGG